MSDMNRTASLPSPPLTAGVAWAGVLVGWLLASAGAFGAPPQAPPAQAPPVQSVTTPSAPPAGAGKEVAQPQEKTGAAGYWAWHPTYGLTYWPAGATGAVSASPIGWPPGMGSAPRPFVAPPVITPGTPARAVATSRPPAPAPGWSAGTTPTGPTRTPAPAAGSRGITNDDCPT